jgi:hypothetical protein
VDECQLAHPTEFLDLLGREIVAVILLCENVQDGEGTGSEGLVMMMDEVMSYHPIEGHPEYQQHAAQGETIPSCQPVPEGLGEGHGVGSRRT